MRWRNVASAAHHQSGVPDELPRGGPEGAEANASQRVSKAVLAKIAPKGAVGRGHAREPRTMRICAIHGRWSSKEAWVRNGAQRGGRSFAPPLGQALATGLRGRPPRRRERPLGLCLQFV